MGPLLRGAAIPLSLGLLAGAAPVDPVDPVAPVALGSVGRPGAADDLAEVRAELERDLRRGAVRQVLEDLDALLEEEPDAVLCRELRARARLRAGEYAAALEDARRSFDAAGSEDVASLDARGHARIARTLADVLTELGRADEAVAVLEEATGVLRPDEEPRDAWTLGGALLGAGRRDAAFEAFRAGSRAREAGDWEALLAQARCLRAIGALERAAEALVAADALAKRAGSAEADVLVELGSLYFETYGEVDDAVSRAHSPAKLYREALQLAPGHEGANLGLFELYRFNWMRRRHSPEEFLEAALEARPSSIAAQVQQVSAALNDGQLPRAREALARLEDLAPGRRDVRAEKAALAWIEHRREDCEALLAELLEEDPGDSAPEATVGRHLVELYRFAEGLPFLERAVERDPHDWRAWTQLGRARANTGDEDGAREALERARTEARGRRDAWRDNMALVLDRMEASMVVEEGPTLTFAWSPEEADVLRAYLPDFYRGAREELAARYGFTPDPVRIEVFREWQDFSVRSTGFEGFPALGVCFGPVVTAVSPLCELRGTFSWARTSFHEFTHVIHLGLSHNRCPRWITEGLATWEEGTRDPAWWRNMRRDLLDARANGEILPVRELNGAFRGPRVIFAYYQSGLLCQMLIDEHGFAPMVRLLEAFDRGLDLDEALAQVFRLTPEEVDRRFAAFVDRYLADLAIEPRWSEERTFRMRFALSRRPPEDPAERVTWARDWCSVAWGFRGAGQDVDAEEVLRNLENAGALPPSGHFLRAEIALASGAEGSREEAAEAYRRGFEAGGEDYRARMALGELELQAGRLDEALLHFRAAERAFPGYPEPAFSAELRLARLHTGRGEIEAAMEARQRWLAYNAGDFDHRVEVARWLAGEGRHEESLRFWREANEVDPFRRKLHRDWGLSLAAAGRWEEALREAEVGLDVPQDLDGDLPAPPPEIDPERLENLDPSQRELLRERLAQAGEGAAGELQRWQTMEPELHALAARALLELGRVEEARARVERALELDPASAAALEVRDRLP